MALRTQWLDGVQLGVETTFGTGVAANRKINTFTGGAIQTRQPVDLVQPMGNKFPCGAIIGKTMGEASLDGPLGYIAALYALSSAWGPPSFATTTATITPSNQALNSAKFYTLEVGQASGLCDKMVSSYFRDVSFRFGLEQCTMQSSLIGRSTSAGATVTASPTEHPCTVVAPLDWKVQVGANIAGLADIGKVLEADFSSRGSWAMQPYGDQTVYPVDAIELRPDVEFSFLMNWDSAVVSYMTEMFAGTTKIIRIACANADTNYTLQLTAAVKVMEPEISQGDRLTTIRWRFRPVYDATATFAVQAVIKTTLTAL